jgi:hypothetical protein
MCDRVCGPHSPAEQTRLDHQVRVRHICCGGMADPQLITEVGPVDLVTAEDFFPFEAVTLCRVRDVNGEPTALIEIEGLRQDGMRTRVVPYTRLLEQADLHWEITHVKSRDDPQSAEEFAHATIRAAVAFLMD